MRVQAAIDVKVNEYSADTSLIFGAITVMAALITLASVRHGGRGKSAWSLIGFGLLLWGVAEIARSFELVGAGQEVSAIDLAGLAGYPFVLFGLAKLIETRIRQMGITAWLDAAIGALCVVTLGSTLLIDYLSSELTGSAIENTVELAYPIFDLLLLAGGAGALALTGWRPGRGLALAAAAAMLAATGDAAAVYESVEGAGGLSGWLESLLPLGAVVFAAGAVQPPSATRRGIAPTQGWRALASPSIFAIVVLGFGILFRPASSGLLVDALTVLTLLAIVARLTLTYGENSRLVGLLQRDALTGLGNRSRLSVDLKDLLLDNENPPPHVLTMLDLDGFKSYNDAFGHPAGDALLSRLARSLERDLGRKGRSYRLGGDEFAVLSPGTAEEAAPVVELACEALSEHGEGFMISSSAGTVELPTEAPEPDKALQIADQRMYQHKDSRRPSPIGEVQAVVLRIVQQRAPELGRHGNAVSTLAVAIGEQMGLSPSELSALSRAAELHDVGKMAIPDAILNKEGPLDDEEWEFMRQHTVLGARILSAAPSLAPLSDIVRSSHERWDGQGYPDGIAGDEIPLAARIVFVCDAYDAMIQQRAYAPPLTAELAMVELKRCAGTQFDPAVVDAFMRLVDSVRAERGESGMPSEDSDRRAIHEVITEEFDAIVPEAVSAEEPQESNGNGAEPAREDGEVSASS